MSRQMGLRWTHLSQWLVLCMISFVAASASANQDIDQSLVASLSHAVAAESGFTDRFDAQVWLVDMSGRLERRMPDEEERLEFLRLVHRESTRAGLNPELVLALIQVESNFDRFALSWAGARGYMQVMPFWTNEIGRPDDNLFDMETNLRYGTTILAHYLERERGNLTPALARYNGSYGQTWYPERVFNAWQSRWLLERQ
ncbi:lytic transglycosylase domain-containing protein [Salinispirillum sp. LH 10-3-1]|uniref:Lytic transglycosylase domain-containing protein n=1 Tax=Salinispirillum sp. LH 10-3-1 TaxID=2952525 RepID=A0AB38YDX9_9GAMM